MPCRQSLQSLLTGIDQDAKPVHVIPYERFSKWQKCLPAFIEAGLIRKTGGNVSAWECGECKNPVEVEKEKGRYFYQCNECGFGQRLSEERTTGYESSITLIGDFLCRHIPFETEPNKVMEGMTCLGRISVDGAFFNMFLARGLSRGDSATEIYRVCQPINRRTHTIILSFHCEEVPTGNARVVQIPLIDLLGIRNGKLVYDNDKLPVMLAGIFGEARGATKEEGESAFRKRFLKAVNCDDIKHGDREKWAQIAKQEYSIARNRFRQLWNELAPGYLKQRGAPSRAKSAKALADKR